MNADEYIKILDLEKHPEGGYYREIYRSAGTFENDASEKRNFSTSIYFLLKGDEVSNFHRIKSDEVWHHYTGSAVKISIINIDGTVNTIIVGKNIPAGEMFQFVIPAGVWFAAEVVDKDSFTLVGCTVSPGFDFEDFQLASRKSLLSEYPQHEELINRFTKS